MFEAESPFQSISQGGTDAVSPEATGTTANGWAAAGEDGLYPSAVYANNYDEPQSMGHIVTANTADLAIDLPNK